jgi:hypothetical protein
MTRAPLLRKDGLTVVFDIAVVLIFAIFLWAPWDRFFANTPGSSAGMLWLALPVTLARHGVHLEYVTNTVTISALAAAGLGALIAIVARMRGSAVLLSVGAFLFGCSVAILMPLWTAVGFLGALLLILAARARFVATRPVSALTAFLSELWPVGYALSFAALAWRYNPQLLLKTLIIAFGISLVARALIPSSEAAATQA